MILLMAMRKVTEMNGQNCPMVDTNPTQPVIDTQMVMLMIQETILVIMVVSKTVLTTDTILMLIIMRHFGIYLTIKAILIE